MGAEVMTYVPLGTDLTNIYVLESISSRIKMNIFHVNNRRGTLCLSQGRRMGYPACIQQGKNDPFAQADIITTWLQFSAQKCKNHKTFQQETTYTITNSQQSKPEEFDSCNWPSNLAQINFSANVTLSFDGWLWKRRVNLFHAPKSYFFF